MTNVIPFAVFLKSSLINSFMEKEADLKECCTVLSILAESSICCFSVYVMLWCSVLWCVLCALKLLISYPCILCAQCSDSYYSNYSWKERWHSNRWKSPNIEILRSYFLLHICYTIPNTHYPQWKQSDTQRFRARCCIRKWTGTVCLYVKFKNPWKDVCDKK